MAGEGKYQDETACLIPKTEEHKTESRAKSGYRPSKLLVLAGMVGLIAVSMVLFQHNLFQSTSTLVAVNGNKQVEVKCQNVHMPELTSPSQIYRYSKICYPNDGKKYPLHIFAHGDFGGGPFGFAYNGILHDIASRGFVVSMYLSCAIDQFCDNGNGSFLEILKSVSFLETNSGWWDETIDFSAGYSASGHSTGGRAVLMLAALVDNPTKYLATTKYASMITKEQRKSIQKFQAIVGDHPDPVYLSEMNPDLENFVIDKTPTMSVTGSNDRIEPELSAWKVFEMILSTNKVYVNMLGANHLSPLISHQEGPYIALFSQCFIDGIPEETASEGCEAIYGNGPDAIQRRLAIAGPGDRNSGDGKVGFLGCRGGKHDDVPAEFAEYCSPEN